VTALHHRRKETALGVAHRSGAPWFLRALAKQAVPEYLWIGCGRQPRSGHEIIDLPPGEVFVPQCRQRGGAMADLNCLTVLQFAVDILQSAHHRRRHYGCAACMPRWSASASAWPTYCCRTCAIVAHDHRHELSSIEHDGSPRRPPVRTERDRAGQNVCETTIRARAWLRGAGLQVTPGSMAQRRTRARSTFASVVRQSSPAAAKPPQPQGVESFSCLFDLNSPGMDAWQA